MTSDWRRPASRSRPNDDVVPPEARTCLAGKTFLLELENRQIRTRVAEQILSHGGEIVATFDECRPFAVVSDHSMAQRLEKDKEVPNISERVLKSLPALLREAVKSGIKIRTPQTFQKHLDNFRERSRKTTSATTSNSTMRGKPQISRERNTQPERALHVVPRPSRVSSDHRPRSERAFLRIDLPGRRPDIRFVDRDNFNTLHAGIDAGHHVFKTAEPALQERRIRDFELFKTGNYQPTKKNFKLDDVDDMCAICVKRFVGERKDHERTEVHRQKAKNQGRGTTFERILLTAKLRTNQRKAFEKRKEAVARERRAIQEASKRAMVEYEYGENELKANWSTMKRNIPVLTTPEKITPTEVRRRQKRIRYSPSQGDGPPIP